MAHVVSAPAADWIAVHVLTDLYLRASGGLWAIRRCLCQIGVCGPCLGGLHDYCTPRLAYWRRTPMPSSHVVGATAHSPRMPVLESGPQTCVWRCPCVSCMESVSVAPDVAEPAEPAMLQLELFALAGAA